MLCRYVRLLTQPAARLQSASLNAKRTWEDYNSSNKAYLQTMASELAQKVEFMLEARLTIAVHLFRVHTWTATQPSQQRLCLRLEDEDFMQ